MPYIEPGTITVTKETKARLDSYRDQGSSWDDFFNEVLILIEQKVYGTEERKGI